MIRNRFLNLFLLMLALSMVVASIFFTACSEFKEGFDEGYGSEAEKQAVKQKETAAASQNGPSGEKNQEQTQNIPDAADTKTPSEWVPEYNEANTPEYTEDNANANAQSQIPTESQGYAWQTSPSKTANPAPLLSFQQYSDGSLSINVPYGWQLKTGGSCTTLQVRAYDPNRPLRQYFYMQTINPIYMSQQKKDFDKAYVSMGGYPVSYLDAPVVSPFTPENCLKSWSQIANTNINKQTFPDIPEFDSIEILSSQNVNWPGAVSGATTQLFRVLVKKGNDIAEGQFLVSTVPLVEDIGAVMAFIGITAPTTEYAQLQSQLLQGLNSYTISPSYASMCMQQSNAATSAALKAGQTLSEASDIIMEGWENRQKTDDVLSQKRSDAMLGYERVYNPNTGEVYRVENNWYDNYEANKQDFQMQNLQQLQGDDYRLWTAAPRSVNEIR